MKKLQIVLALAAFMALTSLVPLAFSDGSGAGIAGSPHDFSDIVANSWNTREEVCRSCHVPHDHQRDIYETGLLWNHASSNATYTTYTHLDGTVQGQRFRRP